MSRSKNAASLHRLVVDENNRAPLYHQLFLILRSKIIDGEYSEASHLLGENGLAKLFGVSRITAIRALNELAALGLVSRERGRGTVVRLVESGTIIRGPAERAYSESQVPATPRDDGDIEVVSLRLVLPPPEVAKVLAIASKTKVRRIVRIARFEGKPYRYVTSYLPADIGNEWKRSDLRRSNIAYLIERSGIAMGRIDERMTATLGDTAMARYLEVAVGAPLIKITRTVFDTNRRAIEHVFGYYPPERYEYTVSVTRQGRLLSPLHGLNS